jgi:hypothetical protein
MPIVRPQAGTEHFVAAPLVRDLNHCKSIAIEHDPEKHGLGLATRRVEAGFPRDKREAFARRSCSNKEVRP